MAFVEFLHRERLSGGTVKNYLAAVRYSQISLGLGDPKIGDMPCLDYVVKGLKRLTATPQRPRLPITPQILDQLREAWESQLHLRDASMLWAAATMCFFGFLRVGEVVAPSDGDYDPSYHLSYADVRADARKSPQYLQVHIKASKTDPFRKGVSIFLGRAGGQLCPVAATLDYMVRRGNGSGPFFQFGDGRALTRERFVSAVRTALTAAGIDATRYAGHSFRIGAATTAALRGIQDSLIKTLGRWESTAYTVYIRTPRETLCAVSRTLVGVENTAS